MKKRIRIDSKKSYLQKLQQIPGVGESICEDLWNVGIHKIQDLKNKNPEILYKKLCTFKGTKVDPCVLYVFRCAVYFASNKHPDPQLLKWWKWKNS